MVDRIWACRAVRGRARFPFVSGAEEVFARGAQER